MGVRDENRARMKYNILQTTLELMKEKPFECITVKEICSPNNISEVTFFKIFRMKEEILLYFMQVWNLKRTVRISESGMKKGVAAIYLIFKDIALTDNSLNIMISLISFLSNLKKVPNQIKLDSYDKVEILKNEDYRIVDVEELEMQLLRHLKEAVADNEIHRSTDLLRTVKIIAGIFYGVPLVSHMGFSKDLYGDYTDSLDLLFMALKQGKERQYE